MQIHKYKYTCTNTQRLCINPGPGNFAPFWMVPVLEKIGPRKKFRYRYRKNLVPEKVTVPVPEKIGPEKSTGPGTGKNSGYRHTLLCIDMHLAVGYLIVSPSALVVLAQNLKLVDND